MVTVTLYGENPGGGDDGSMPPPRQATHASKVKQTNKI